MVEEENLLRNILYVQSDALRNSTQHFSLLERARANNKSTNGNRTHNHYVKSQKYHYTIYMMFLFIFIHFGDKILGFFKIRVFPNHNYALSRRVVSTSYNKRRRLCLYLLSFCFLRRQGGAYSRPTENLHDLIYYIGQSIYYYIPKVSAFLKPLKLTCLFFCYRSYNRTRCWFRLGGRR